MLVKGKLSLKDGNSNYRTKFPLFKFDALKDFFARPYNKWIPESVDPDSGFLSATGDVANAHGSWENGGVLVNKECTLKV